MSALTKSNLSPLAFHDRLESDEEKVIVLPCLQEITTNPDGLSITPPGKAVKVNIKSAYYVGADISGSSVFIQPAILV